MKWVRLKYVEDMQYLSEKFECATDYHIPPHYLLGEDVWGLFDKGDLVGGFAIVSSDSYLRTVDQMADYLPAFKKYHYKMGVAEVTCYFSAEKKHSWRVRTKLMFRMLKSKAKYFIYSYSTDNEKLKEYYSRGNPRLVYSGRMDYGNGTIELENVEMVTKWGVVRGSLKTTLLQLKKKFYR